MSAIIHCARCQAAHYEPLTICPFCSFGPVLPPPTKRTVAQQTAFLMAVSGIVQIIPATLILFVSLFFIFTMPWITLGVAAAYAVGVWLIANFFRYSKQRMAYGGPFALWGVAAVYTFIGLALGLYGLGTETREMQLGMVKYWSIWMGWLFSWAVVALFCELNALEATTAEYERAHQVYSPTTAFLNSPTLFQPSHNLNSCL